MTNTLPVISRPSLPSRLSSLLSDMATGDAEVTLSAKTGIILRFAQVVALIAGIWLIASNFEGLRYELRGLRETTERLTGIVEGRMDRELRDLRDRVINLEKK